MKNKVMNLAQKELQDFEMPKSNREAEPVNREILKKSGYNLGEFQRYIVTNKIPLTQNQIEVYETILSDVNNASG